MSLSTLRTVPAWSKDNIHINLPYTKSDNFGLLFSVGFLCFARFVCMRVGSGVESVCEGKQTNLLNRVT